MRYRDSLGGSPSIPAIFDEIPCVRVRHSILILRIETPIPAYTLVRSLSLLKALCCVSLEMNDIDLIFRI